jgi:HAD superfamily hydrolase (TIGR01484 family)
MIRENSLPLPDTDLSLDQLLERLRIRIPFDRPHAVVSDFDETICSTYKYNEQDKIHQPLILSAVWERIAAMESQLIIATSRSPRDSVVRQEIASLVASHNVPIICENGAVLFLPGSKEKQVISLATVEQTTEIEDLLAVVSSMDWREIVPDREVLIAKDRVASFEIRVQEVTGKGDPSHYTKLIELLKMTGCDTLEFISSGSSLSVQPKGISKATGINAALAYMGLSEQKPFIIGMGDGMNDRELFAASDLSVAVDSRVAGFADLCSPHGDRAALAVLESVR